MILSKAAWDSSKLPHSVRARLPSEGNRDLQPVVSETKATTKKHMAIFFILLPSLGYKRSVRPKLRCNNIAHELHPDECRIHPRIAAVVTITTTEIQERIRHIAGGFGRDGRSFSSGQGRGRIRHEARPNHCLTPHSRRINTCPTSSA